MRQTTQPKPEAAQPNNWCQRCGQPVLEEWRANNPLWAYLATDFTMLCIGCFDALALGKDIVLFWQPRISKHSVEEHPELAALAVSPCEQAAGQREEQK